MSSYLMGFTQFMLLSLRGKKNKNVMSQQRSASNGAGTLALEKKDFWVFFFVSSHAACGNQMTSMSYSLRSSFFFFFVTSVHVQFIQKGETAFTQSQSQHSGSQPLLFYNHTITIFMRTCADGKTISPASPPPSTSSHLPVSFVVLILFCGLILMKSLVVNRSGIRWSL